jgi:hypothetical protein
MPSFRALCSVTAAGLLPSAGAAEVNTTITWQVSVDNQAWSSSLAAAPGSTVYARAVVSYTGTAQPLGLAGFTFQPIVSNWLPTHTLLPFVNGGAGGNTSTPIGVVTNPDDPASFGRLSPWGRANLTATQALRGHVHLSNAGGAPAGSWLRLAQTPATSWIGGPGNSTGGAGVNIAQLSNVGRLPSDPAFSTQLQGIVVFKFGFVVAESPLPMTIDSPMYRRPEPQGPLDILEVHWFASMDEASASIRGEASVSTAQVFVPAPASACPLLIGWLISTRRRRK